MTASRQGKYSLCIFVYGVYSVDASRISHSIKLQNACRRGKTHFNYPIMALSLARCVEIYYILYILERANCTKNEKSPFELEKIIIDKKYNCINHVLDYSPLTDD